MSAMLRFPRAPTASPRLGGPPPTGATTSGYPWHDGELLYAADLNAAFATVAGYSIADFGAVSDGVTDDTAALNAAITAVLALPTGGKVVLNAGRTIIASAIVVSVPAGKSLTLEGMGPQASELYFSNATDGLNFTLRNAGSAWGGVSLRGFTVTRGPTSPAMANTGINIIGDPTVAAQCGGGMSFRDLVIQGSTPYTSQWMNGMILNGISSYIVDNVNILAANATATDQGDACLTITGPGNPHFSTSCNLVNCTFSGGTVGLLITGYVQGVLVVNSTIIGQYDSIRWTGGSGLFAEELAVSQCSLNGGNRGIYVTQCNGCSITGCDILHLATGMTTAWAGIELNVSAYNSVVGNLITCSHRAIAEYGIIISNAGNSPNQIMGNSSVNMLTGNAVWLSGTTTGAVVIGNSQVGANHPIVAHDSFPNIVLGNSWDGLESGPLNTTQPIAFLSGVNGAGRWFVGNDGSTESDSNVGNNFEIVACSDAGTAIYTPITINRANGFVTMQYVPTFTNVPGNFTNDAAAAAGGVVVGEMYRNGSVLQVRVT